MGVVSGGAAIGTITNDDATTLSLADVSAAEGGSLSFTATLNSTVEGGLTATPSYSVANGTAEAADYTANTTALSFTGTASESKTFTVATTQDTEVEPDETFTVALTISKAPGGVTGGSATATITNDDSATVTIADASATEPGLLTFTATLNNAVEGGVTATPSYTNGTAESADYTANTTALSFTGTANEQKSFTVLTTQDAEVEPDETYTVTPTISGLATGVSGVTGVAGTGTIANDDSAAVTVDDAEADEGDAITFTVTLDAAVEGGLTVTPGFTNGTATSTDYTANTATLSFTGTAGETQTFTVSTTEDAVLEADETFTVDLTVSATSLTVTATDTGTIDNDDSAAVTVDDASADEGDDLTFTVTLSEAVQGGLTVTPGFTDVTAVEGTDYDENTTALSFTGTRGETQTFTVATTEDAVLEADETFTVDLTVSATSLTVTATDTGTGTITDDDSAAVTVEDAKAEEGDSITFTVTLSAAVQGGLEVTPSFTDVSAVESTDYDENTATLTFTGTAGETETFTVSTTEDAVREPDETFTVDLTVSATTLTVTATDTATGTIEDDDRAEVTVEDVSASEGESMTFTVTLDKAVQGGLTVTPSFTDVTAVEGTDYDENTTALSFTGTADETQTFTVSTTEDAMLEGDETFTVGLTVSGTPVTATDTGTGTISDDDSAALTVADASADEGESITFTVTLSAAVQGGLTVTPGFTDVTTDKSKDYTENTAALSFTGTKDESKTFTVATTEDTVVEGDETFTVTLAVTDAPSGISGPSATGTVTDDDHATLRLTANPSTVAETAGATEVTLTDDDQPSSSPPGDPGAPMTLDPIFLTADPSSVTEGGGTEEVTVTATVVNGKAYPHEKTIMVTVGGGSATSGTDYATVSDFTITIEAEKNSGSSTLRHLRWPARLRGWWCTARK